MTQGGIALGLVGGAAAGFGRLVAGRVLVPLHRVTGTARRIAAAPAADRGLRERIALPGPDDEVQDLAAAFNTMVGRLDRSFDGQRRFVANAASRTEGASSFTRHVRTDWIARMGISWKAPPDELAAMAEHDAGRKRFIACIDWRLPGRSELCT
jgi:HAMP domain-containing protein